MRGRGGGDVDERGDKEQHRAVMRQVVGGVGRILFGCYFPPSGQSSLYELLNTELKARDSPHAMMTSVTVSVSVFKLLATGNPGKCKTEQE